MSVQLPILHLVCGKIASGKSTLTAKLSAEDKTILIAEDDWLAALFSDQMTSIKDYVRCSAKLKTAMGPHIVALLNSGMTVVLDFPANTIDQRAWLLSLAQEADVPNLLHYLDVPDEICLARLRARNEGGGHAFSVSDEQFRQITAHFVAPSADEGFEIIRHDDD